MSSGYLTARGRLNSGLKRYIQSSSANIVLYLYDIDLE